MNTTYILNGSPSDLRGKIVHVGIALELDGWCFNVLLPHADSVYFPGGDSPTLIDKLRAVGLARKDLEGKVIVAMSAGVSALTAHSMNFDHFCPIDGLGIIQVSSVVHYTDAKKWAAEYLELKYPGLSVLGIADSHKTILEVNDKGAIVSMRYEEIPILPATIQVAGKVDLPGILCPSCISDDVLPDASDPAYAICNSCGNSFTIWTGQAAFREWGDMDTPEADTLANMAAKGK